MPKNIVFIDDREENLLSVQEALERHYPETHYEGLHYLGASTYPSVLISEEEFIASWEELIHETKSI